MGTTAREKLGAIFDMDGVLVDSSAAHYQAWSQLGEELGQPHPREIFEQTFGMHNRQIIPLWLGEDLAPDEVERLSLRKEELYRQVAARSLKPLDGVVELITSLSEDAFLLAVGSSGPSANVELVLNLLGVRERFNVLSTGDDVQHGKPHPEVFLKAAEKLQLPPASCVVIEDAPQGVLAGLSAGARVVAVSSTRPREELSRAHWVVDSLTEIDPPRLRELIARGK